MYSLTISPPLLSPLILCLYFSLLDSFHPKKVIKMIIHDKTEDELFNWPNTRSDLVQGVPSSWQYKIHLVYPTCKSVDLNSSLWYQVLSTNLKHNTSTRVLKWLCTMISPYFPKILAANWPNSKKHPSITTFCVNYCYHKETQTMPHKRL